MNTAWVIFGLIDILNSQRSCPRLRRDRPLALIIGMAIEVWIVEYQSGSQADELDKYNSPLSNQKYIKSKVPLNPTSITKPSHSISYASEV